MALVLSVIAEGEKCMTYTLDHHQGEIKPFGIKYVAQYVHAVIKSANYSILIL